jgi:tetratricopeptide (TPR) repeat protein
MKLEKIVLLAAFSLTTAPFAAAQVAPNSPPPAPPPAVKPTPRLSETLAQNLENSKQTEVTRERREQAYAKLLEGQRYFWNSSPVRSQGKGASAARMARQAFQKAVELDPNLAEGYTALAELAATTPPGDADEAIMLATIATRLNPNNFGARRLMARLYTIKSGLVGERFDPLIARKAIAEWKEVTRLDARNAEAWAFLSDFYEKTNQPNERIDALTKWIASAAPIDSNFYRRMTGGQVDLSPESATLKLGEAYLRSGKTREATEIFSRAVADDPDNAAAVEMLRRSLESGDAGAASIAVESLQQAVFANPENPALIVLLAQTQARAGRFDEASKVLQTASARVAESDRVSAGNLQVALGDLLAKAKRTDEAVAAYQKSLNVRGLDDTEPATDDEREFVIAVFDKMIQAYKNANRPNDVKTVIERARRLLGKSDIFADRQAISFFRESGMKAEALQAVRQLRARDPEDYGNLRLEATILTENGKVDEAVNMIKSLLKKKSVKSASGTDSNQESRTFSAMPQQYDDFTNHLFISNLYSQASRGKDAIEAANQAYAAAVGEERRQIAKLTLATAQQTSGDFKSAEETLRQILRQTPDNPIALNNLGYFLLERGEKIAEAFGLIERAVKIDPTNPSFLDSLGWAYYKLGKYAEAEEYLLLAASFDNASAAINEHLGDVYDKQKKPAQARESWQKALNLASESADVNRLKTKLNLKNPK